MSDFQTVAKVGDIPEGQGRSFPLNGTMVGVFLSAGRYLAINDFCPQVLIACGTPAADRSPTVPAAAP